ncbi:TIGR02611 family protein [Corynebacterium uropygiale]|uniref:TIGR02611 family protein n=1 Tax=Corynebacterium uropygiale TaxID=1775911 RepID=A0A9X1TXD5_9CORY|nr:TIGR02611 family protein [Corynebacterium uropygiale]MCF4005945.1 TIGR02611 family protein [Corynebacterium uropygiale]
MATMRQMVHERIEQFKDTHQKTKESRYGFLVRPLTLILGWTVMIAGIIMIPLPGQGWLTVFIGVGILSLEQKWASNLLTWGVRQYDRFVEWYGRQSFGLKAVFMVALIVLIWVVFIGLAYAFWKWGSADWLDPAARWIGLRR